MAILHYNVYNTCFKMETKIYLKIGYEFSILGLLQDIQ